MDELKWKWAFGPYLDPPEGQKESAIKAGYVKVVSKQSADEAIAELKAELDEKDKDIAYWREEYDKETQLTDALKDEIESLKASHYAEMVDAGMRERRLKRALYIVLARSFCCMRELAARNALYDDECKWDNFKTTCLKKAEEYK